VAAGLPLAERGGFSSAAFLATVARLAGIPQFMAQAEGMLECDRPWLEGVMAEKGMLEAMEALPARLPDNLEPLAGWTRTGALSLPHGECRRQKWWSRSGRPD